jgi:hypothetical protein
MLMNFDLVKWRLASLKAYAAPTAGVIQEQIMLMLLKW